ncbi:MAG TPA: toll/interleukin-1 receptor domain-containing protein [Noviherbaspirillum sp.]|nr:toll/interleukin-1 receptor domain-containing protein [Noviherbaspirillum sp.]
MRTEPIGRNKQRRFCDDFDRNALSTIRGAQRALLKKWLKDDVKRRTWDTLLKLAIKKCAEDERIKRVEVAETLTKALVACGAAILEERLEHTIWKPVALTWCDYEQLCAALELPTSTTKRNDFTIAWEAAQHVGWETSALADAYHALPNATANTRQAKLELLLKLNDWIHDKKSGTRLEFAIYAREHTKQITPTEWAWLEKVTNLSECGIEHHSPLLCFSGEVTTFYNLLIHGNEEAWLGTSAVMPRDRLFEYTQDAVIRSFKSGDLVNFDALKTLPTLFAYERYARTPARVGRIIDITHRNDGYGLTFAIDPTVPPIPPDQFETLLPLLDIDPKQEMHRTHWAVKHVDLGNVLHQAKMAPTPTLASKLRPPRVFISYSWDSQEHKLWVAKLAEDLYGFGVEVILDQWHVEAGQDLPAFMNTNVQNCDRVLVVCTELYVQKAQKQQGGVAYEQLLVTSQMMQNVGTTKFIPIVRQSTHQRVLPPWLAGRLYIDLSEGASYQEAVEDLARQLHNMRPPIPPLGQPPGY